MKYPWIDNPIITIIILMLAGLSFIVSPSLSAGILIGLISFFLINLFLSMLTKSKNVNIKRGIIVSLINFIKFGVITILLFIFIKHLKFDPLLLAAGYSLSFSLTIAKIFIMRPKES